MAIDELRADPLAHSQPTPTELGQKLDAILERIQEVGHIRAVEVNPGDVIVFSSPNRMNSHQGGLVHAHLRKFFPNQEILILTGGDEIGVIACSQNAIEDESQEQSRDLEGRAVGRARDPNSPL
jgi:hypothetical protein